MSMLGPKLQCDRTYAWLDIGLDVGGTGGALYTAGTGRSTYHPLDIGDPQKDVEEVAYLDQGGTFSTDHGVRKRMIVWSGFLRVSATALAAIMVQRDAFKLESGLFTFTSDLGLTFASCRLDSFVIPTKQRISEGLLEWRAPYQIVLTQLEVG